MVPFEFSIFSIGYYSSQRNDKAAMTSLPAAISFLIPRRECRTESGCKLIKLHTVITHSDGTIEQMFKKSLNNIVKNGGLQKYMTLVGGRLWTLDRA